jgi:hypothetical protein
LNCMPPTPAARTLPPEYRVEGRRRFPEIEFEAWQRAFSQYSERRWRSRMSSLRSSSMPPDWTEPASRILRMGFVMTVESMNRVFVALVEVMPLDGCRLAPRDYGGAAVRCHVAAETEEDAIGRITAALQENRFQLVGVEWCVDEAAVEWEKPHDATGAALISEARRSKNVVFGEFHTWPRE